MKILSVPHGSTKKSREVNELERTLDLVFNRRKSATTAYIDYCGLNSTRISTPWPIVLR